MNAYHSFSHEQRPLLPKDVSPGEREKLLSQRWKALSKAEKAHYKGDAIHVVPTPSPYTTFCRERRPLLPAGLRNAEREAALGQLWRVGGDPRGGEGPTSWPFKKRKGGNKAYILGKSYKTLFSRVY